MFTIKVRFLFVLNIPFVCSVYKLEKTYLFRWPLPFRCDAAAAAFGEDEIL